MAHVPNAKVSTRALPAGYEIREMTSHEFNPLWNEHAQNIFGESQIFRIQQFFDESEKQKARVLQANMGTPLRLNLGLFFQGEFVGWSTGEQESWETYYMRNSAVLPNHRRKGLYTALLRRNLEVLEEKGFHKIYSRHSSANNDIIIAKLKLGFIISALEVSDVFGTLVHLVYFPREIRRKVMVYRTGDTKPDDEIKACLKL